MSLHPTNLISRLSTTPCNDPIIQDLLKLTPHTNTALGTSSEDVNTYSAKLSELLYLLVEEKSLDESSRMSIEQSLLRMTSSLPQVPRQWAFPEPIEIDDEPEEEEEEEEDFHIVPFNKDAVSPPPPLYPKRKGRKSKKQLEEEAEAAAKHIAAAQAAAEEAAERVRAAQRAAKERKAAREAAKIQRERQEKELDRRLEAERASHAIYPSMTLSKVLIDNYPMLLRLCSTYFNLSLAAHVTRFVVELVYSLQYWEVYHLLYVLPDFDYFLRLVSFDVTHTPLGPIVRPPVNYLEDSMQCGLQFPFPYPFYNYSYHSFSSRKERKRMRVNISSYDVSLRKNEQNDKEKDKEGKKEKGRDKEKEKERYYEESEDHDDHDDYDDYDRNEEWEMERKRSREERKRTHEERKRSHDEERAKRPKLTEPVGVEKSEVEKSEIVYSRDNEMEKDEKAEIIEKTENTADNIEKTENTENTENAENTENHTTDKPTLSLYQAPSNISNQLSISALNDKPSDVSSSDESDATSDDYPAESTESVMALPELIVVDDKYRRGKTGVIHQCHLTDPGSGQPCKKIFYGKNELLRHQEFVHATKKKIYKCIYCTESGAKVQSYPRHDSLARHIRRKHGVTGKENKLAVNYAKDNVEVIDDPVAKIQTSPLPHPQYLNSDFTVKPGYTGFLSFSSGKKKDEEENKETEENDHSPNQPYTQQSNTSPIPQKSQSNTSPILQKPQQSNTQLSPIPQNSQPVNQQVPINQSAQINSVHTGSPFPSHSPLSVKVSPVKMPHTVMSPQVPPVMSPHPVMSPQVPPAMSPHPVKMSPQVSPVKMSPQVSPSKSPSAQKPVLPTLGRSRESLPSMPLYQLPGIYEGSVLPSPMPSIHPVYQRFPQYERDKKKKDFGIFQYSPKRSEQ